MDLTAPVVHGQILMRKELFLAEYCENGAKAVAEEATKNKVTPLFFATNSIQELSELSDYEIEKADELHIQCISQKEKIIMKKFLGVKPFI